MKIAFAFYVLISGLAVAAQPCVNNSWTWIKGDSLLSNKIIRGNAGIMGVPASGNDPSARSTSGVLKDGVFWIYNGHGYYTDPLNNTMGPLPNLWKYDVQSNTWTWVNGNVHNQGVFFPNYGTKGQLGTLNHPGRRTGASLSIDAENNLWIFGGIRSTNFSEGPFPSGLAPTNELWMFDTEKNQWAWMYGTNIPCDPGNYVDKGSFSPNSRPANRDGGYTWIDKNNILWLYSGLSEAPGIFTGSRWLNDVWKFDFTLKQWCWVAGEAPDWTFSNGGGYSPPVHYSELQKEDILNTPGSRLNVGYWIDEQDNFWLFGGSEGKYQALQNDLWRFNIKTGMWAWMSGSQNQQDYATYGFKNIFNPNNKPSGRTSSVILGIRNDKLYMYGGRGMASVNEFKTIYGEIGPLSDLWCYDLKLNQWAWVGGDTIGMRPPIYGNFQVEDKSNSPGTRTGSLGFSFGNSLYIYGGGVRYKKDNTIISRSVNDVWKLNFTNIQSPILSFSVNKNSSSNLLQWQSVNDKDFKYKVERSFDNNQFFEIAVLSAIGNASNMYTYTDQNPWTTGLTVYYRIVVDGGSGCKSLSNIVDVKEERDMWISPNPGDKDVTVFIPSFRNESAYIRLISTTGVLLQSKKTDLVIGLNKIAFPMRHYSNAMYFIEIQLASRKKTFKFIKHD
jgi:hypothetical protein